MPTITTVIPASLDSELHDAAARSGRSIDSLVYSAVSESLRREDHRLYQFSTATAMAEGVFQGALSSYDLRDRGDFGIGTFADLDGELVMLDGVIYQARGDGTVTRRDDEVQLPFALATRFQPDVELDVGPVTSFKALAHACDQHRESDNLFYALRIDGHLDFVHARAVTPATSGTRLIDAAAHQADLQLSNLDVTLVGFWSPAYSDTFSVAGYHVHFLSNDRRHGGHVFDCRAQKLHVQLQALYEYDVQLPQHGRFLATDLSRNPSAEVAKVE